MANNFQRRIPSPQRPVSPTWFETSGLGALAQVYMGKKQQEQKALMSAFPAMVAAKMIQPATLGMQGALQFGGKPWQITEPSADLGDVYKALQIKHFGKPKKFDLDKLAATRTDAMLALNWEYTSLASSMDPEDVKKAQQMQKQVYDNWRKPLYAQYGYSLEEGKTRTINKKPPNIPQAVWDRASDAQKKEYFNIVGR